MTLTIPSTLQTQLNAESSAIVFCLKITREDAVVLGFTSHDQDLTINSQLYKTSGGFSPSNVEKKCDLSVDGLDIQAVINDSSLTETDLKRGLYDNAQYEVFIVDSTNVSNGTVTISKGWFGEVSIRRGMFVTELRGLMSKLQTQIGELYGPSCTVRELGDSRCKVSTTSFRFSLTVTAVTSNRIFKHATNVQADSYFKYGIVDWTSGNNDAYKMEVKAYTVDGSDGVFELQLPMPRNIQIGDTFRATRGCDRTFSTCKNVFNNVENFRGFPHLPGVDQILRTP